jgi:competence protein ComEA
MADSDPSAPGTAGESQSETSTDVSPATEIEPVARSGGSSTEVLQTLGLSRTDVRFAFLCGAAILLLMAAHWAQRAWDGARFVEIDRLPAKAYEFRLDINSATWVEWMQLEGIGEVLARRIVENRERSGPFSGVDDLRRVPGIGPKTLEDLRPHLICTDCSQPGDAQ